MEFMKLYRGVQHPSIKLMKGIHEINVKRNHERPLVAEKQLLRLARLFGIGESEQPRNAEQKGKEKSDAILLSLITAVRFSKDIYFPRNYGQIKKFEEIAKNRFRLIASDELKRAGEANSTVKIAIVAAASSFILTGVLAAALLSVTLASTAPLLGGLAVGACTLLAFAGIGVMLRMASEKNKILKESLLSILNKIGEAADFAKSELKA